MTSDTMSKYLIAQLQYVKQSWVKEKGKGISENRLHDDIKICVDPKIPRSLWLEKLEESFVLSWVWDKEKILSPHEESNLRPSDSALQWSTTKPQRLYGERGLLRSSYYKPPAYCLDQQSLGLFANVIFLSQNFILTISIASPTWFLIKKNLPSNLIMQLH